MVFGEWLGLSLHHVPEDRCDISIRLGSEGGGDADQENVSELRLPDMFFPAADAHWLQLDSLGKAAAGRDFLELWTPNAPVSRILLPNWGPCEVASSLSLCDLKVPVLFGDTEPSLGIGSRFLRLPIDILGSIFFMLSRYEEVVLNVRDKHDRFPASASLAYRAGFLDRPIVDEYVEILWSAMQRLWPGLERKQSQPRIMVSCDVDHPYAFTGAIKDAGRRFAGDLIKRRSLSLARRTLVGNWRATRDDHQDDPYRNGIDWIMDVNERVEREVAFYFIPENTDPRLDNRESLDQPRMRALLRHIHTRGHEIGIHPGYNTYRHPEALYRSVKTLRRVLDEEGINQSILGGRQHYLRWETPTTARLCDDNGLHYDTTLSYADRPGFRCGTCHEYQLYDVVKRRPLKLRERPLIVMESTVLEDHYLGMGYTDEALALMQRYRSICHQFGGDFTILWHNSHLAHAKQREFYQALVR